MATNYVKINGVTFELQKNTTECTPIWTRSLDQCYDRPSYRKQNIYDFWCEWFESMGCEPLDHGVSSYNCNFFTYNGYFSYEGQLYYAYITHAHNRLYKVA